MPWTTFLQRHKIMVWVKQSQFWSMKVIHYNKPSDHLRHVYSYVRTQSNDLNCFFTSHAATIYPTTNQLYSQLATCQHGLADSDQICKKGRLPQTSHTYMNTLRLAFYYHAWLTSWLLIQRHLANYIVTEQPVHGMLHGQIYSCMCILMVNYIRSYNWLQPALHYTRIATYQDAIQLATELNSNPYCDAQQSLLLGLAL